MSRTSSSVRADWRQVLVSAGIDIQDDVAGTTSCPLCTGGMTVYQDNTPASVWLACGCCHFTGSAIQLAAQILELPLEMAALRLARGSGLVDHNLAASSWMEELRVQLTVQNLWKKARKAGTSPSRMAQALGLRASSGVVNWEEGPGQFLGLAPRKELEELVGPLGNQFPRSMKEVVISPLWGPPGRIEAFWASVDTHQNNVSKVVSWQGRKLPPCYGPSIGLEVPPSRYLGRAQFLFLDVRSALHAQVRTWIQDQMLLPVVGTEATAATLEHLLGTGRDIVLWGSQRDERLYRHARALSGRVARMNLRKMGLSAYVHHKNMTYGELLASWHRKSCDWKTNLEQDVAGMADGKIFTFLLSAGLTPVEMDEFARGCPGELADRLSQQAAAVPRRSTTVGTRMLEETNDCWRIAGSGAMVMNAALQIQEIVRLPRRGITYYRGHVRHNRASYSFVERADVMDGDPAGWLNRFLLDRDNALAVDPSWSRKLVAVSRQLHSPVVVRGCDQVGWEDATRSFLFPRWSLLDGGKVIQPNTTPLPEIVYPYDPPRPELETPALFRLDTRGNRTAFAIVAALIANLRLQMENHRTPRILISETVPWKKKLGLSGESSLQPGMELEEYSYLHALILGIQGDAHVITASSESPIEEDLLALSELPGMYLRDLVSRPQERLKLERDSETVLKDLLSYAERNGLPHREMHSVIHSELRLDGSVDSRVRCFADTAAWLLCSGDLSVVPERFYDPAEPRLVQLPRGIWFPVDGINRVLTRRNCPVLKFEKVLEVLQQHSSTIAGTLAVKGQRGVVIDENWWNRKVRALRDEDSGVALTGS